MIKFNQLEQYPRELIHLNTNKNLFIQVCKTSKTFNLFYKKTQNKQIQSISIYMAAYTNYILKKK